MSMTILSLCLGFIHNSVILSRVHSQSCHCVQGSFTILSFSPGSIHNLVNVPRIHSQSQLLLSGWTAFLGVWEINNLATLLGCDRSGRSRISGLFIVSTVPDLTWWQCSLCCCQLGLQ